MQELIVTGNDVFKECKTCKEFKSLFAFEKSRGRPLASCKDCENTRSRVKERELREAVLAHYGGKCVCCDETQYEFLSFDHINGGGNKHRRLVGSQIQRWLKRNNYPKDFQILCHNCNSAKGFYKVCPHEKDQESACQSIVS